MDADGCTTAGGWLEAEGAAFQAACQKIRDYLGMEGSPVAVTYRDAPPAQPPATGPRVVCQAMQDARFGATVTLSRENSICTGANYFLGLIPLHEDVLEFWVEVERAYADRCVASCALRARPAPPPQQVAKTITLLPVERCDSRPDLVLFVCDPAGAARLTAAHAYGNTRETRICSYASACAAAIGIPMTTGDLHLSFIDSTARKIAGYRDQELIATVPAIQVRAVSEGIDGCRPTTAFLRIEERLKANWSLPRPPQQPDLHRSDR